MTKDQWSSTRLHARMQRRQEYGANASERVTEALNKALTVDEQAIGAVFFSLHDALKDGVGFTTGLVPTGIAVKTIALLRDHGIRTEAERPKYGKVKFRIDPDGFVQFMDKHKELPTKTSAFLSTLTPQERDATFGWPSLGASLWSEERVQQLQVQDVSPAPKSKGRGWGL